MTPSLALEGINLDMSRGKPGADQLDLSAKMLDVLNSSSSFKGVQGLQGGERAGREDSLLQQY